jgi:hypothetical protein
MILRKQINNFVRCVNGCECDKRQPLFLPPKPFKVQQIAQNVKEDTLGFQYMCLSQNRFSEGGGAPLKVENSDALANEPFYFFENYESKNRFI